MSWKLVRGATLSPKNADTTSHMLSDRNSASGDNAIQTLISVSDGEKKCLIECSIAVPRFHHVSCQGYNRPAEFVISYHRCRRRESPRFRQFCKYPHVVILAWSRSVLVHTVHPIVLSGCGARVGAWRCFDDCVSDFREFLHVFFDVASATASDVVVSSHSAKSAEIRRMWLDCESSPVSFSNTFNWCPRRRCCYLRGRLSWDCPLSFAPVVLPSTSTSAGVTRFRSVTDCVLSLDVVSWLGIAVVAVSGSSGELNCILWIGPIKMGSRLLRGFQWSSSHDWCPTSTDPKTSHSMKNVPEVVFPLRVSTHDIEPCHLVLRSSAHLLCCHVWAKHLRAMLTPICWPVLLVVCTQLPLQRGRLG